MNFSLRQLSISTVMITFVHLKYAIRKKIFEGNKNRILLTVILSSLKFTQNTHN